MKWGSPFFWGVMHFDILMQMNLNLMKLQAFGKILLLICSLEITYNIANFCEDLCQRVFQPGLKKTSAIAIMYSCSLGWPWAAWPLALCDVRAKNFFHGWAMPPMSLSNREMGAGGFASKTWTSSYGTWHQRRWRLRRDPWLDMAVKNGIGDQLAEKGVTSQKGVIPCRTERKWNSVGLTQWKQKLIWSNEDTVRNTVLDRG